MYWWEVLEGAYEEGMSLLNVSFGDIPHSLTFMLENFGWTCSENMLYVSLASDDMSIAYTWVFPFP